MCWHDYVTFTRAFDDERAGVSGQTMKEAQKTCPRKGVTEGSVKAKASQRKGKIRILCLKKGNFDGNYTKAAVCVSVFKNEGKISIVPPPTFKWDKLTKFRGFCRELLENWYSATLDRNVELVLVRFENIPRIFIWIIWAIRCYDMGGNFTKDDS